MKIASSPSFSFDSAAPALDQLAQREHTCCRAPEILHRYVAINRHEAIQPAFDALLGVVDDVFPVDLRDVERAKTIVYGKRVSARDALHAATMEPHGVRQIMTFDTGFDALPGLVRIS